MTSTDTRIIITGAASGICAATMAELQRRGAQVVGLDRDAGHDDLIACDVRDQASVDDAVAAAVDRLGHVDVLINGAGLGTPQSAGVAPDADALAVIDVNLLGPWRVTSAALPALREARGRVVNVASGLSFVALPFATAYAMSKRGVVAYSDALRLEHGDAISVTTVYPGYIRTPIHEASQRFGLSLEGMAPPERIEDAVAALVRAALDERPPRDLATTRSGRLTTTLMRYAPRGLVDRLVLRQIGRHLRGRAFDDPAGPVATFARRVAGGR